MRIKENTIYNRSNKETVSAFLLLFFLLFVFSSSLCAVSRVSPKSDKLILHHANKVSHDQFKMADVQVFKGDVSFEYQGLLLFCDSANYYELTNSFDAFGHVKMLQGDTLSLHSEYLYYDGNSQVAKARRKVVLKHRKSTLYTDSLNYDRLFHIGYFFEGGKLVDDNTVLTSDWGQYNTTDRQSVFIYNVKLVNKDYTITTDTMHYDTRRKDAHMVGPSNVVSGDSHIYTESGYFNTVTKRVTLLKRSVLVNKNQEMVGDSVIYNKNTGIAKAYNNVIYQDKVNKNILTGDYCFYNEKTGYSLSYKNAQVKNYSQKDTLYLHADTFKIYTYNIRTDSAYRVIHGYYHTRSFRLDMQSVADSLSYNSHESRLSLYGNPIVWNEQRQILGEEIHAYLNDSTIDSIYIIRQALLAEKLDTLHFNQITGTEMHFYFHHGELYENRVIGNVQIIYYQSEKDSLITGMNYTETSLFRMFMENKKMSRIWMSENTGTYYPLALVTKSKMYLSNFAWFDYIRPRDEKDIFVWRAKTAGTELKQSVRHVVPFQNLNNIK